MYPDLAKCPRGMGGRGSTLPWVENHCLTVTALAKVANDFLGIKPVDTFEPFSCLASQQNLTLLAILVFLPLRLLSLCLPCRIEPHFWTTNC